MHCDRIDYDDHSCAMHLDCIAFDKHICAMRNKLSIHWN